MKPAALVVAGCLAGCATLMASGPDDVPVTTTPPGAYVYLDGQVVGQTPMVLVLDRKRTIGDIRIYYPGFQPVQVRRTKGLNGWLFANICWGLWPAIVDFITGDWERYDDTPIAVALTPGQAPPPYGMQPQLPGQPSVEQPPPMQPPQPPQPQPMQPPMPPPPYPPKPYQPR